MAVIKADAYGHGFDTVCEAVHDQVDAFAVATIAEGIQCRNIQKHKPVVVLSEFWQQSQLHYFQQFQLQAVVHSPQQVDWICQYRGEPLSVWIKVDSGMNRLGIEPDTVEDTFNRINGLDSIKTVRLMSHLANADDIDDGFTDIQLSIFREATDTILCERSLANSAGVMRWPETHLSWIRPGLMLYGASPCNQRTDSPTVSKIELMPVMQLQARLIAIKTVESDQAVGYGGAFRTRRKSRIGIVGLGYGDGYPRLDDSRACVLIGGHRAPVIGMVSMDMITIDITDLDSVNVGDEVLLWGHGLSVDEVARWAGTIPYELLCKITSRIPRIPVRDHPINNE